MKSHAKVVVIGGGVVGASVLYHLTKAGWKDVLLIERAELTSGSTWHAAGGMHTVNGDPNVAKLQQYTIGLYKEIEAISGQSCGVHITGGVMLAGTRERLDWLKMAKARGRYLGMDLEIISVDEAAKIFPLMEKKHFTGAMYDPIEGHVDPYGVTHAYAKSAQIGGADIVRHTRVTDLQHRQDGGWDVITDHGNVHAEHVVNAGGLWAREVGRMVGLELPVLAMEHQYLITGDMPELAGRPEQLHAIDFEGEIYLRQERGGMLMGTYERAGVPWSPRDHALGLRPGPAAERSRADRAQPGGGLSAFSRAGERRDPQSGQWPVHLRSGRQSADRTGARPREFLGGLRRNGGLQPGRRRGPGAVALDGRRRSGCRCLGHGRGAVRRLDDSRLHQCEGARKLLAPLPDSLPQRGTARRAAAAHHADLRTARGGPCRVRRLLRPRTSLVVCAERRRGGRQRELPPLQRASARCRGMLGRARCRGPAGDLQLRQVRGSGAGRRGVALRGHGESRAQGGPCRAHADAERSRKAHRRLHDVPHRCGHIFCSSALMRPKRSTCAGSNGTCRRPG